MNTGLNEENENRSMMNGSYNDSKLDKSKELNDSMTISPSSQDEYTNAIHNIGGNQ